jgi:hypothetical protein
VRGIVKLVRDDVDAAAVVGALGALHDARHLTELAADLLHDLAAGPADRLPGERGEDIGQDAADEQAHDDLERAEVANHLDVMLARRAV